MTQETFNQIKQYKKDGATSLECSKQTNIPLRDVNNVYSSVINPFKKPDFKFKTKKVWKESVGLNRSVILDKWSD